MSCVKCIVVALAIFAVPLTLGTVAALQYPQGPAGAFFGRFVGYLMQVIGSVLLFQQVFGATSKKRILDKYRNEGVDFQGVVTQHHITTHRTNCIETGQGHRIDYVYHVVVDEENDTTRKMYKKSKYKHYSCTLCRGQRWRASTAAAAAAAASGGTSRRQRPIIPLKRLPLLPGSGYPLHYVAEELSCYWWDVMTYAARGLGIAVAVPFCFASYTEDSVIGIVAACCWALVTGVVMGRLTCQRWEQDTLFNGEIITASDDDNNPSSSVVYPHTIATRVSDDDDEEEEAFRDDKEQDETEMTKVIV